MGITQICPAISISSTRINSSVPRRVSHGTSAAVCPPIVRTTLHLQRRCDVLWSPKGQGPALEEELAATWLQVSRRFSAKAKAQQNLKGGSEQIQCQHLSTFD